MSIFTSYSYSSCGIYVVRFTQRAYGHMNLLPYIGIPRKTGDVLVIPFSEAGTPACVAMDTLLPRIPTLQTAVGSHTTALE